jgi:hypothetical protein
MQLTKRHLTKMHLTRMHLTKMHPIKMHLPGEFPSGTLSPKTIFTDHPGK